VGLAYGGRLEIEIPGLGYWNRVLGGKTECADDYEVTKVQDPQVTIVNNFQALYAFAGKGEARGIKRASGEIAVWENPPKQPSCQDVSIVRSNIYKV
jgi:hypothetical protein